MITRVWIEDGCTQCGLCEEACPDVFELGDEAAQVKNDADLKANEDAVREAAEGCPVEVIYFEEE